ncbi:hypothetical protein GCM10027174_24380 [Salinifilum aidingensis]
MTGSASDWHELHARAEALAQASHRLENRTAGELSAAELAQVREALHSITGAGRSLSRQLDRLSQRCRPVGRTEPSDSQVALDQAAAAAEDLGACSNAAAQALQDEQEQPHTGQRPEAGEVPRQSDPPRP